MTARLPSEKAIKRLVETARELGLDVAGVSWSPADGTLRTYPREKYLTPDSSWENFKFK
jgi:hypothetical protein